MRLLLAALFALTFCAAAHAHRYHHHHHHLRHERVETRDARDSGSGGFNFFGFHAPQSFDREAPRAEGRGVIGGRPRGCPHAFCGCGASLFLFGKIIDGLNLAANWARRFPPAAPAPGMAAVHPHHVFVLERHIAGNLWMTHDSNSGGGLTREHPRDITGWKIVNPRA